MGNPSYRVYEPKGSEETISKNQVVFGLWAFGLIFFWAFEECLQPGDLYSSFKFMYILGVLALSLYWLFVRLWTYEPLNGNLDGDIQFRTTSFIINNQVVQLENLVKIDIHGMDYYGRRIRLSGIDFEANLSQGVGNFIEFTSIENISTRVYFKQSIECQYRELRPFIVSAIQLGKLSFLRGIELLGITDYDEIQEFKKAMDTSAFVSSEENGVL